MTAPQGTQEWLKKRLGKITSSTIHKIMSSKENSSTRTRLMQDLIFERISGSPTKNIVTAPMARGLELESEARKAYELQNEIVILSGFIEHPTIKDAGASPDGLIGDDGLIEIKCLNKKSHEEIIRKQVLPRQYYIQIQFQLACTQRLWCDFVAYHPDADKPLYVQRIKPEIKLIKEIHEKALVFISEVEEKYREMKKRNSEELYKYL
ncbi:YqaJ viral recombinase family protein [Nitrosomonadales bacterium]|nr:YqaJ viral recombinase family protein [Nitrosomonadales bacterium]